MTHNVAKRSLEKHKLHLFSQVIDNSFDAIYLIDSNFQFCYVNKAAVRELGYSQDELLSMTVLDIDPDITPEALQGMMRQTAATGYFSGTIESRHRRKNREIFPVEVSASTFSYEGETLFLTVVRNTTAYKKVLAELTTHEQEFRSLAENSPDFIIRYDREGRIRYLNANLVRYLKLDSADAVLGKLPMEVWPDGRFAVLEEAVRKAVTNGEAVSVELAVPGADGQPDCHQIFVVPDRDTGNELAGATIFGRDVTAIRETERRQQHFVDSLPGLAFTFRIAPDGKTSFPYASSVLAHPDDRPRIDAAIAESARIMAPFQIESRVCRPGLPECCLDVRSVPERQPDGSILWYGIMLDITERKKATESLEQAQRIARLGSWDWDVVANRVEWSEMAYEIYTPDKRPDHPGFEEFKASVHPDDLKRVVAAVQSAFEHNTPFDLDHRVVSLSKGVRTVHAEGKVFRDVEGRPVRMVGTVQDITERKQAEEALQRSGQLMRTVVDATPDWIFIKDREHRYRLANKGYADALHIAPEDFIGKDDLDLGFPEELVKGDPEKGIRGFWADDRQVMDSNEPQIFPDDPATIDGVVHTFHTIKVPLRDDAGKAWGVLAYARDITELSSYREKIHQMAFYDTLTLLPNRALFNDRLRQMVADSEWHSHRAGVMLLDLDHFKVVNDTLGHSSGDVLLREAAVRLASCVRTYDTVARLGGDEFAILLPEVRSAEDLGVIAGKILQAFTKPFLLGGKEVFVGSSIGIVLYPDDGTEAQGLLSHADSAMYFAKQSGRNTFRFYSKELTDSANERLELEADLRRGFGHGELELYYQPKIGLEDGSVLGSEALLRWNHPQRGMVPPDKFIPISEDCGLIVEIGEWVLRTACRTAYAWNASGQPRHKVAINLSVRQFQSGNLVQTVCDALDKAGCKPEWIELEITESLLLEDENVVLEMLNAFRDMGISIAIDDFGTGYSALGYLARYPIDTLKIDRSFTSRLGEYGQQAELVKAIISIAKCLEQQVVAEGVETTEQADLLQSYGCHMAQGYFYGKPMPQDAFEKFSSRLKGAAAQ